MLRLVFALVGLIAVVAGEETTTATATTTKTKSSHSGCAPLLLSNNATPFQ